MTSRLTRRSTGNTPFVSTLSREVEELRNRARQLFDEPGSRWMRDMPDVAQVVDWYPAAEVAEDDKQFTVSMELPGMKSANVNIDFNDGMLTIRGEKTAEREEKDESRRYHLWERSYGSFQRSFEFPTGVDGEKITAEFGDGVLRVQVPKRAEAKENGRKIVVKDKT